MDTKQGGGGLISGLGCGYLFAWSFKNPLNRFIKIVSFVLPTVLIITCGFIIHKKLPNTYTDYQNITGNIDNLEKQALEMPLQSDVRKRKATVLFAKTETGNYFINEPNRE